MQTFKHMIGGEEVTIYFPESDLDLGGFDRFILADPDRAMGFDTETTGLEIFSSDFKVRLVQFGSRREAWVLQADRFADSITWALESRPALVCHNATFDLLIADRHLGAPLDKMQPKTMDTRIAAHLIDPRQKQEGGIGLGLKDLSARYVDPSAPDTQGDLTAVFRTIRDPETGKLCTKANGWRVIPIDHPTYVLYAGLDPILTVRLLDELGTLVNRQASLSNLFGFEHKVQLILARMQRRGFLVDVPYTEGLRTELDTEASHWREVAESLGVVNLNSTRQVAEALIKYGETLTEKTPSGQWKVDRSVLQFLADMDKDFARLGARDPNPVAEAVMMSKRAEKWNTAYVSAFLEMRDSDDRLHASINGLQARTARMSISDPPLQQLPSGDWKIRRCLVADPGNVMISTDYSQQELVALAALSQDAGLLKAVHEGADLHDFATTQVYGPKSAHTSTAEWKAHRKICKAVSLGRVYGGGAATIQRQTGAPMQGVKAAIAAYDEAFPGVKRLQRTLQQQTGYGRRPLITATGRQLPLDRDRTYAAVNYACQSLGRDITAQALINLDAAGLGEYLILPVHDEVIAQAPPDQAEEIGREIGKAMTIDALGVTFRAEAEVGKRSWGSLKGGPE